MRSMCIRGSIGDSRKLGRGALEVDDKHVALFAWKDMVESSCGAECRKCFSRIRSDCCLTDKN